MAKIQEIPTTSYNPANTTKWIFNLPLANLFNLKREAYKDAYNAENMKDESIDVEACKLYNDTKVAQRYQELIGKLEDISIMTAIEKRRMLREMAINKENSVTDRIKAIDTDNKMAGEYITQIKADVGLSYEEQLKKVSDDNEY